MLRYIIVVQFNFIHLVIDLKVTWNKRMSREEETNKININEDISKYQWSLT